MKTISWLVMLAMAAGFTETLNFDSASLGRLPSGWAANLPEWKVIKDTSAPSQPYVLAQVSGDRDSNRFPIAIFEKSDVRDGEVSVKFKPVSGVSERSAGLVWRYRDAKNYYVVRANALEKNVVPYRVQNGKWIPLVPKGKPANTYGVSHPVESETWSILKVVFKGPAFSVYYDHRRILQGTDGTFSSPGKVGLWTKADSVVYFDNFRVVRKG